MVTNDEVGKHLMIFSIVSGVATGIYTTNSPEGCLYCLTTGKSNIFVAEDEKQVDKILRYRDELPELKAIIQYTGTPAAKGVLSVRSFFFLQKA